MTATSVSKMTDSKAGQQEVSDKLASRFGSDAWFCNREPGGSTALAMELSVTEYHCPARGAYMLPPIGEKS